MNEELRNVIAAALHLKKSTVSLGGGCETCGYGAPEEVCIKEDDFGAAVEAIARGIEHRWTLAVKS